MNGEYMPRVGSTTSSIPALTSSSFSTTSNSLPQTPNQPNTSFVSQTSPTSQTFNSSGLKDPMPRPFPSSSSSSSIAQLSGNNLNTNNTNVNQTLTASPGSPARRAGLGEGITVESVLRNAGGDMLKAIKGLVEERNSLAIQNAQLWKMVEKRQSEKTGLREDLSRAQKRVIQLEAEAPASTEQTSDQRISVSPTEGLGRAEGRRRAGTIHVPAGKDGLLKRPAQTTRSFSDNVPQDGNRRRQDRSPSPSSDTPFGLGKTGKEALSRIQSAASSENSPGVGNVKQEDGSGDIKTPVAKARGRSLTGDMDDENTPTQKYPLSSVSGLAPVLGPIIGLLPAPSIMTTQSATGRTGKESSDSRMTFDPEIKEYMSLTQTPTPSPGKDLFSSVPGPSRLEPSLGTVGGMDRLNTPSPDQSGLSAEQGLIPPSPFSDMSSAGNTDAMRTPESATTRMTGAPSSVGLKSVDQKGERSSTKSAPEIRLMSSDPEISLSKGEQLGRTRQNTADNITNSSSGTGSGRAEKPRPTEPSSRDTGGGSSAHTAAKQAQIPRLVPRLLPYTRCTIPSSRIVPNTLGKEALSFIINVQLRPPGDVQVYNWTVAKFFSSFVELDTRIRQKMSKKEIKVAKLASLPEGRAWKDYGPAKMDRMKATLETYIQNLLACALEFKSEVCSFLQTDVTGEQDEERNAGVPKSGYLTKRGKNFGGVRWRTRFFVLEGPALHYYEQRGGALLGSIPVVGAKIGKQHKDSATDTADEKAYRHAFLLIEPASVPSGGPTRHVLCAESDAERDSWVKALMRHVVGEFNDPRRMSTSSAREEVLSNPTSTSQPTMPRSSTSSSVNPDVRGIIPARQSSRDEVAVLRGTALPISSLAQTDSNSKLFQGPSVSYINKREQGSKASTGDSQGQTAYRQSPQMRGILNSSPDVELSSSLPSSIDTKSVSLSNLADMADSPVSDSPQTTPMRQKRQSMMPGRLLKDRVEPMRPSLGPSRMQSGHAHTTSLEREVQRIDRGKISAPNGGVIIPQGFMFGAKDPSKEPADRERKVKSRLWGFNKASAAPIAPIRPVFGVPLQESVEIAAVAGLPAVVFRCIRYLEAKGAEREEGIFRLSGSSAVIKGLRDRFNADGDFDLLAHDERWDLHAITGLLKMYLREVPSILTHELHMHFLGVTDLWQTESRIQELTRLVNLLPIENYTLLRALVGHIILICSHADENRMGIKNIGIVFAPSLYMPAGILSDMIQHYKAIFEGEPIEIAEVGAPTENAVNGDTPPILGQDSSPAELGQMAANKRTNRNSMIYATNSDVLLNSVGRELTETGPEEESDGGEIVAFEDDDDVAMSSVGCSSPGIDAPSNRDLYRISESGTLASPRLQPPLQSPGLPKSPRLADMQYGFQVPSQI